MKWKDAIFSVSPEMLKIIWKLVAYLRDGELDKQERKQLASDLLALAYNLLNEVYQEELKEQEKDTSKFGGPGIVR